MLREFILPCMSLAIAGLLMYCRGDNNKNVGDGDGNTVTVAPEVDPTINA